MDLLYESFAATKGPNYLLFVLVGRRLSAKPLPASWLHELPSSALYLGPQFLYVFVGQLVLESTAKKVCVG